MNQYEVEDNVPDTPQVTLDNYDAAVKALQLDVKGIKQWRADTEMFLGALFEQAKEAGDEVAMNNIMVTWERDQLISDEFVKMYALQKGLRKMVQSILNSSNAMQDMLEDLEEAIAETDEQHPGLNDFAHNVRRDERVKVWKATLEKATLAVMDEFYAKLKVITGRTNEDHRAVFHLMNLLTQRDLQPSELQRALIVELVNLCAEDIAQQEAANV